MLKFQSHWGFSVRIHKCGALATSTEGLQQERRVPGIEGKGKTLWGSVTPISATQVPAKNTETNNLTPGREQGRSSCQCRLVKPVLFLYVTG